MIYSEISLKYGTLTGSKIYLKNILKQFNRKKPSIEFKYELLKERIAILDSKIYVKDNKLHTKTFKRKQTVGRFLTSTQNIQNR